MKLYQFLLKKKIEKIPNTEKCLKPIVAKKRLVFDEKSFAIDVETKLSCPVNQNCLNSIETCFEFENTRVRATTGSGAGRGAPVENERGT